MPKTLTMKNALESAGVRRLAAPDPARKTIHIQHTHYVRQPHVKNPENLFAIKDHAGVAALRYWLQKRKYNTFVETTDKNGKPMFGLMWDYHHGTFPSPNRKPRGCVLILDRDLQKQAALIIINWMADETDYARQWKQAQRELWTHGRA